MKSAKLESKKIIKTDKPRRMAGLQVRSGVKAGTSNLPKSYTNPQSMNN